MSKETIFRVIFINHGVSYEIYTHSVGQSTMFGFLEIGPLVFGKNSGLLVDPNEEKLKQEFLGVISSYIPMHAVIRIDEVEKEGTAKIKELGKMATVTPISYSTYVPAGGSDNN